MKAYGGLEAEFHVFFTSVLGEDEWSVSRSGTGERGPGTHWPTLRFLAAGDVLPSTEKLPAPVRLLSLILKCKRQIRQFSNKKKNYFEVLSRNSRWGIKEVQEKSQSDNQSSGRNLNPGSPRIQTSSATNLKATFRVVYACINYITLQTVNDAQHNVDKTFSCIITN